VVSGPLERRAGPGFGNRSRRNPKPARLRRVSTHFRDATPLRRRLAITSQDHDAHADARPAECCGSAKRASGISRRGFLVGLGSAAALGSAALAAAAEKPAASPPADAGPQEAPRGPADFKLTRGKAEPGRTTRILLVTGQEHPAHKWQQTAPVLAEELSRDGRLLVDVSEEPRSLAAPQIGDYAALVLHFMNPKPLDMDAKGRENLRRFTEGGKGLVLVHFACGAFQEWPQFKDLVGRVWDPKLRGHDPRGKFRVEIAGEKHPITEDLKAFDADDELYTCLTGDRPIQVLAAAKSKVDGKDYPMAFVYAPGKGRVFQCLLGHDVKALQMPTVGELYRRGTAWAAGLAPVPQPKQ